MRHPVSTPFGSSDFEGGLMLGGIIGFAVVPSAPEDADPSAGEDADGVGMRVNRTGFPGGPDFWKDGVHDEQDDAIEGVSGGAA